MTFFMKIKSNFNELVYREQMDILFDLSYAKYIYNNKITVYYALFFLAIASFSYFQLDNSSIPTIGTTLGLTFLLISLDYFIKYKKIKKNYFLIVDQEVKG